MIKIILKVFAIIMIAALVVIQFFRIDKTNPPIVEAESLEAAVTVPDDIRAILERSCKDCHSHRTEYPWYSNVAPVSWFLKNHIDVGRRKLNFSVFNTYAPKKRAKKLEEMCEQIDAGEMPLPSYLWIHRDSALREGEANTLCEWATQEKEKIVVE